MSEKVLLFLENQGISYKVHHHPPVLTVEEARKLRDNIHGLHCKNLFLKDKKRQNFYLLTAPADKQFKISTVRKLIAAKNLSFTDPNNFQEILGVELGAASPFGLINVDDEMYNVTYLLDQEVLAADIVTFHPNVNTMTLELSTDQFQSFLDCLSVKKIILNIETENPQ